MLTKNGGKAEMKLSITLCSHNTTYNSVILKLPIYMSQMRLLKMGILSYFFPIPRP